MHFRRRRRIESKPSSSTSGQMMTLSLFIMLLAFFIVLNSISSYEEEKTARVQRSVELAFSSSAQQEDYSPSVTPDPAKSINNGDAFERLEVLFESQISSFEMSKSQARGIMIVKVPYTKFSEAMLALDQKDLTKTPSRMDIRENFFLPTLVSLLRTEIDGAPTRMEIYLNVDGNPAKIQNNEPQKLNEVMDKLGVFSAALEKQGIPQKLLNIGISKGDSKFVNLVFKRYVPFSPVKRED